MWSGKEVCSGGPPGVPFPLAHAPLARAPLPPVLAGEFQSEPIQDPTSLCWCTERVRGDRGRGGNLFFPHGASLLPLSLYSTFHPPHLFPLSSPTATPPTIGLTIRTVGVEISHCPAWAGECTCCRAPSRPVLAVVVAPSYEYSFSVPHKEGYGRGRFHKR
jgi:hypothetical protein